MRLTALNPGWLSYGGEGVSDKDGNPIPYRERIGIHFDCPCGCDEPLAIIFTNPIDGKGPIDNNGRHTWERVGDDFDVLTLAPSIRRIGGCQWHGWLTAGAFVKA